MERKEDFIKWKEENKITRITLPLPPSDNRRLIRAKYHKGFVLSEEHRKYKEDIVPKEMLKYKGLFEMFKPTFEKQLFIAYRAILKDKKRDGSNCEKALKDSLKGILYDDDKWVNMQALATCIDSTNPRCEIYFKHTEE